MPFEKGKPAWNKNLTKETDERVAKYAKKLKKNSSFCSGSPWNKNLTKETDERVAKSVKKREKPREIRICRYLGCDTTFECMMDSSKKYCSPECYWKSMKGKEAGNKVPRETRICECGECDETFECKVTSKQRYIHNHHRKGKSPSDEHINNIISSRKNNGEPWHTEKTKKKIGKGRKGKALWGSSEGKDERVRAIILGSQVKPNKPETFLIKLLQQLFPNQYKYVGDGEFILAGKCPDFVNVNGQKKVIELFGVHWHKPEEEQQRIDLFFQYGYQTLVVWDYELSDTEVLSKKLIEFCS